MSKTVLLLAGHTKIALLSTRRELVEALLASGYKVIIAVPFGEGTDVFESMGCQMIDVFVDRRGKSLFQDFKLFNIYKEIIKANNPDVVLTFNIKSNIYGGLACKSLSVPYITNITGLGTSVESGGVLSIFVLTLLKMAVKKANCIFFQNNANFDLFKKRKMVRGKSRIIPGSGVNIERFQPLPYPESECVEFTFIGRLMPSKGIYEYINAAKKIKKRFPNTIFHIYGFCEDNFKNDLSLLEKDEIVKYHGSIGDVRDAHKFSHCFINPSHHEGMSNVLLEAAACARPVIASDVPGCRETFDEGVSGFGFKVRNAESLENAIERFMLLNREEKVAMGIAGRQKMEREFNREIVVKIYLEEVANILNKNITQ